jgi:hypothetical protein
MPASRHTLTAALLVLSIVLQPPAARARQKADAPERPAPACDAERALQLVREQLAESKAFADGAKRAAVMARAADLLWPSDEAQARRTLAEAFDIASAHYREHGQEYTVRKSPRRDSDGLPGMRYILTDPRVAVIRVVARRDAEWAQKLSERAADETRQRVIEVESKTGRESGNPAEKLITMAASLQSNDPTLALTVARESLRHPASRFLSQFIYNVARKDRAAADAFYAEALRAYSAADLSSLLQLSGYPFGLSQNLGLRPGYNGAGVPPPGFAPRTDLQRLFVGSFLRLAAQRLEAAAGQPPPQSDSYQQEPSDAELIYKALITLENLYGPSDKNFIAQAAPLRQAAGAMLSGAGLRRAEEGAALPPRAEPPAEPSSVIDNVLAYAERQKDPDSHDRTIVNGLFGRLGTESMERLEAAADKFRDEEVRRQFLEAAYFDKSLRAAREGRPDEAARFAERVGSLEQRAALAWELSESELKQAGAAPFALSVAESVYKSAQAAPESEERVRALIELAHVYWRLEPARVSQLLSEVVAAVNRVPDIDPTRPFITRAIDGHRFNFYTSFASPGFNLETVLREVGERDFDAALAAALNLDDKPLRALLVISLASRCLELSPKPEKPAPPKRPAPKRPAPAKKST